MKILSFVFLMCLLLLPSVSAQQIPALKEIGLLGVSLDPLSQVDHEIGLSDDSVRSIALKKLGGELSEIDFDPTSNDVIRIRIVSVKVNESSVVSYVSVELDRYVSILRNEDNQVVGNATATVWGNTAMLVAPAEDIVSKVHEEIGKQLNAFVSEYRRQNPPGSAKSSVRRFASA